MQSFTLEHPSGLAEASRLAAQGAEFIAGGTDMLQLMKEWIRTPGQLVDLDPLLDTHIEAGPQGLRIGAGARMEAVAVHPEVARIAPAISEALLESASPQVRNLATMGGICCNGHDAGISAMSAWPNATSAARTRAALPSAARTVPMPSWARPTNASRRILRILPLPWWRWKQRCTSRVPTVSAAFRSRSCIAPGIRIPNRKRICGRVKSSPPSKFRRPR